jgi:hypothetical protein
LDKFGPAGQHISTNKEILLPITENKYLCLMSTVKIIEQDVLIKKPHNDLLLTLPDTSRSTGAILSGVTGAASRSMTAFRES